MKYLFFLILIISFNSNAQYMVEYSDGDVGAKLDFTRETQQKAKQRMINIISKSEWMECEWQSNESDTYGERVVIDKETGDPVTEYCKPKNFTVSISDITQELADAAQEKADAKAERQEIKGFIQSINDSDLPQWHKKTLKKLIRDMRD